MSDANYPLGGVEGDPKAATVPPDVAGRRVGDAAAILRPSIVACAPQNCTEPALADRSVAEARSKGDELLRLAEDLQAAIENDDIRLAREAHGALGRQLERAEGDESVVDLARERARRRRPR